MIPVPSPDVLEPVPVKGKSRMVVALSGGADSTALFRLLLSHPRIGPKRLVAAHVNYGLRGASSQKDEAFVRKLCARHQTPLRVLTVRRPPPEGSLQDWARILRYSFFLKVAQKDRAWGVVTAHHLDDQAETVMDRLLRGSGLRGLGALRRCVDLPVGKDRLRVWRPLLSVRHEELEGFLLHLGQAWRKDASNAKTKYRRNRIRHELLPILETFNPRVEETLAHLAETSSEEDALLDRLARQELAQLGVRRRNGGVRWDADRFAQLAVAFQRRVLRLLAEGLNRDARGLKFDRAEEARRVFLGVQKGPRDIGFDLSACRNGSFAELRGFKASQGMASKRLRRVQ